MLAAKNVIDTPFIVINADISGVRILLVEDNELNAEIAEFMLTENGAKVETIMVS